MHTWYFSYDGRQVGPLEHMQALAQAAREPDGYAWREGFAEWQPIKQINELGGGAAVARMVDAPAPPPPSRRGAADQIDFRIYGEDMQFVEVELDPGESAVAEAGAMMYKHPAIRMETIFGDGSDASNRGGFMDKLVGAGKRLITGESLFMTVFTHGGSGKARVAFSAPYPGTVIPVTLSNFGGELICQKDSFLCAARGVQVGIFLQRRILTGLFGGEGFIMQRLNGDGLAFMHAGGTVVQRELTAGESLHVDTGCVVAFTSGVQMDIEQAGGIKSILFGGEGLFFARLTGPGTVWIQSLPFSRLAGRMLAAARPGGAKDEGSILGGLGTLIGGDRN